MIGAHFLHKTTQKLVKGSMEVAQTHPEVSKYENKGESNGKKKEH